MSKDLTPGDYDLEGPGRDLAPADSAVPADYRAPVDFPDDEGQANYRRYIAAVLRNKWWILLVTVLGTAAGVGATQFISPEYEARATLWIETGQSEGGPIRPEELLQSSSWIELLKSSLVMEPVVRDLKLFARPSQPADSALISGMEFGERFAPGQYQVRVDPSARTYVLQTDAGAVVERGSFGDSVGTEIGLRWAPDFSRFPAERSVSFSLRPPRSVATGLANRLGAGLDRNGNFLSLALAGQDPDGIATTLNGILDRYISVAADLKRARLDELVSILEQQVDYAAERLRQAEIALEDFRVETVTLPSDRSTPVAPGLQITQDPVFGNFFQMRVDQEEIRRQQDLIRRALDRESEAPLETLRAVPAVQGSSELMGALSELTEKRSELRALRYRYTDQHPPVRQLLDEIEILETQTIPALAAVVLDELEAQEQQLGERIAAASEELEEIPPRSIEEARLTRRVESANNLYTNLLRRYEEARLSAASSIPDVRILDRAVTPREPIRNEKPQLILMAMLGSLALGIGGAILRDHFDRRLFYPDQVTDDLGLQILAGIPRIRTGSWLQPDNQAQAQEAFRSLRLNVMHAFGSAGPVTVTITSPGPGDGKSFVSANLGRAFADIGKKTLLIDGDTRRGQLHKIMDMERKPGLVNVLKEPGNGGPPIRMTGHDGLFLLTSGSRLQEGPELLSSRRMRDLVLGLRSDFDVIIVDSPPLGAGVDPFVLGTLTGAVLLVLRTGETDRELADAKLDLLERLPIRVLGAVLNGVPSGKDYRYYSYTAGYESWTEEETPAPPLLEE